MLNGLESQAFDRVSWPPWLPEWCRDHLGAAPAAQLFLRGWSGAAVGLRLDDGREVVVKLRPWDQRLVSCVEAQEALTLSGFPMPRPVVRPTRVGHLAVGAESHVPARALSHPNPVFMARLLARLVRIAPIADIAAPAWAHPDHDEAGRWPPWHGDFEDADLPTWLTHLVDAVRAKVRGADLPSVVGHADFEAQNLGRDPTVVYDADSLCSRPEAVHAGLAAAVWCADDGSLDAADLAQSQAFLTAYEEARGPFSELEREVAWAAGLWVDCYNAAAQLAAGRPGQAWATISAEHVERARLAGL